MNAYSTVREEVRGAMSSDAGVRRGAGAPDLRPVVDEQAAVDAVVRHAIDRARRLCEDLEEPFRSLAFTVVLESLMRGHAPSIERDERSSASAQAVPPATDIPITEFLAQRRIDSHPDRVVAIAYYHYHRLEAQGVTTKDLLEGYTRARAKRPQNYPDVIASCVRKGYLIDGGRRDGMKTWVVTRTGENHVEQDL